MLTEQSVDRLRALINQQPQPARDELTGAMEDLARVVASQALLIRNMRFELDNAMVDIATINTIVTQTGLADLLAKLNPPKRNAFTMAEARAANEQLVAKIAQANDFATILKGVVQVAKVFI